MNETELYERISDLARRIGELNRKVDFILTELKLNYHDPDNLYKFISSLNKFNKKTKQKGELDLIKRKRKNAK